MKSALKQKAIKLRKNGFSYSDIQNKLRISKSTLSLWLRDILYIPNSTVKDRLIQARESSKAARGATKNKSQQDAICLAHKKIGKFSTRDMFMFGLGLYCGEGSKSNITRIVNSDYRVIQYAINWFKKIYGLEKSNFTIRIHVYPDTDIASTREFWSSKTNLPLSCFQSECIDTRTKKKKANLVHYGTAHLTILSNGIKERGVLLLREILASIDTVLGNAGVV